MVDLAPPLSSDANAGVSLGTAPTRDSSLRRRHRSSEVGEVPAYEVVLVTYHSREQVGGFLRQLRADQRIVVVDNASGADGVGELLEDFPNARLLDGENVGFARAANLGARTSDAEFLIFANPDTRPTPDVWDRLVDDLRSDPTLGSCAAATVNAAGDIEIGVGGWEPTPARVFVYAFGLHRIFRQSGAYALVRPGDAVSLDWVTGACLAVRRSTFEEVGAFDESFFVYNEDMAFGRSLRAAGYGQRLRTDLLVPHATSGSGGGSRMPQQKGASMTQYLKAHNGALAASVMRSFLVMGASIRAAASTLTGRRDTTRHHVAYIKGVVTGHSPYVVEQRERRR